MVDGPIDPRPIGYEDRTCFNRGQVNRKPHDVAPQIAPLSRNFARPAPRADAGARLLLGPAVPVDLLDPFGLAARGRSIRAPAIGLLSYVALAVHASNSLWAPIIDRRDPPLLAPLLGRRRAWMLLAQLCVAAGLVGLAFGDPPMPRLDRRLRLPHRLRRGDAGCRDRWLAHRRRADRAAGHDVGDLPARLSAGDALRRRRRALYRRFRELAGGLSRRWRG